MHLGATVLRNYLSVALRSFLRSKLQSTLNVCGLTIGFASVIAILVYVRFELSYDHFHAEGDRIYRVLRERKGDETVTSPGTSGALGPALAETFPEIELVTKWTTFTSNWAKRPGEAVTLPATPVAQVDTNFLDLFDFPLVYGDRQSLWDRPKSLVITTEISEVFFGSENPVGETLFFENSFMPGDHTITGVIRLPPDSSLRFNLIAIASPNWWQFNAWQPRGLHMNVHTFVRLRSGVNPTDLTEPLQDLMERHLGANVRQKEHYRLQPLHDIHLHTPAKFRGSSYNRRVVHGNPLTVYALTAIAALILVIAGANFANLSLSQAVYRTREVGMRKASGCSRAQVVGQFLGEAVLLASVSAVLAVVVVVLGLPDFAAALQRDFQLDADALTTCALLLLAVGVGIAAGYLPAWFLATLDPVAALKGSVRESKWGGIVTRGLIVGQFTVSVCLVVGSIVIFQQLRYMQDFNLGFNDKLLIRLPLFDRDIGKKTDRSTFLANHYKDVKLAFLDHPHISAVTAYFAPFGYRIYARRYLTAGGREFVAHTQISDTDYFSTFGMQIVAGSAFRSEQMEGEFELVVNETLIEKLGWSPGEAIGKTLEENNRKGTIVGIVQDFHSEALRDPVPPFAISNGRATFEYIAVRVDGRHISEVMRFLEEKWQQYVPSLPFEYEFLDEAMDRYYREEALMTRIVGSFAAIAIAIACVGLFGLASYRTERRRKEIGIRRAVGAERWQIVALVTGEFAKLVVLAAAIAWPIAHLLSGAWLEGFTYRVDISAWTFPVVGAAVLVLGLITVAYHSVRLSSTDPVETLRYE